MSKTTTQVKPDTTYYGAVWGGDGFSVASCIYQWFIAIDDQPEHLRTLTETDIAPALLLAGRDLSEAAATLAWARYKFDAHVHSNRRAYRWRELTRLSLKDLRARAAKEGVAVGSWALKAQVVDALAAAECPAPTKPSFSCPGVPKSAASFEAA